MKTLLPVGLAVLVLMIAVLPVSADPPDPFYYAVVQNGPCWLPNGETMPTKAVEAKQSFRWVAPLRLQAFCYGQLPKDAPRPKEALKVSYEQTGAICEIKYQGATLRTVEYGAVVYPDGSAEITCFVDLD